MAADDTSNPNPCRPEVRFLQYLYVGKEYPNYQAGNWFVHNYFLAKNIPSITELALDPEKSLLPVELIKQAFQSNIIPRPQTLIFALAVCARQDISEMLRHAAYAAVKTICASTEHFILFIKFASQLSKGMELSSKEGKGTSGWGHGLRTAINDWYISKDPLELAKCVTRYKSRYGWKHKDIIKLSHPASPNKEIEAVFKYIMHGLEESKKITGGGPKFTDIIKYLEDVQNFKRCEDEIEAVRLLELYNLTLDHVPGHLLKSTEMWNALILSMDLNTLLDNLQRIHNLQMLKDNAFAVDKIIDQVTDVDNVMRDKVHPARVFIAIKNYECSGKPLSYEKRKTREQAEKPIPPPPKPNQKIVAALYNMLNISFTCLPPTGVRYMITINTNNVMFDSHVWHSGNLNGAEVGCLIALAFHHSDKDVTVATFANNGVHIVELDKSAPFCEVLKKVQHSPNGAVNLGAPMIWASQQNKSYDVFINVTHQIREKSDKSEEAFAAYREKMHLPEVKLINCAVCSSTVYRKETPDKGILTICGFDSSVITVIQAFAKSCF